MNSSFKAIGLVLSLIISGCGGSGSSDKTNDFNSDRAPALETELGITVTQEVFDSTTPIKQYTFIYDIDGNKLSEQYDADNDGISDAFINYNYDSEGTLETIQRDDDGDGILDAKTVFTNDGLIYTESQYYDFYADGIFDRIIVYTSGEYTYPRLSESIDDNGDGIFNKITVYEYDENNNHVSTSYDYDGDGIFDEVTEYDNHNGEDNNFPKTGNYNTVESATTYEYNSNYDLIIITHDNNGDGIADDISNFTYNNRGQRLMESHDYGIDGSIERLVVYGYDEAGNKLTEKTVEEYGGTTIIIFTADGKISEITYDTNSDGNIERKITYSYSGNLSILDKAYTPQHFNWD
jgi:hypothetical protein